MCSLCVPGDRWSRWFKFFCYFILVLCGLGMGMLPQFSVEKGYLTQLIINYGFKLLCYVCLVHL